MVGGPGGRKDSRLPTDFSLRTTQSTQTRRAESKMKKAIECDNVHPSLIYIASSGVKKKRGFARISIQLNCPLISILAPPRHA